MCLHLGNVQPGVEISIATLALACTLICYSRLPATLEIVFDFISSDSVTLGQLWSYKQHSHKLKFQEDTQ